MTLLRAEEEGGRDFGSKATAVNFGYGQLAGVEAACVGILDADASVDADCFERLLAAFSGDPALGLTGGYVYEERRGAFRACPSNAPHSVPGILQFFRRECFEAIGGYMPLRLGGIDTVAEVMVRMQGWEVRSFPGIRVCHHKRSRPSERGLLQARYRQGRLDFSLGNHPLFETMKCLRRTREHPYVLGSAARMAGFLVSCARGESRVLPPEVMQHLRTQQKRRLRALWSAWNPLGRPLKSPPSGSEGPS
jgi:GT2 family glycosyltransferase